jgi:hypothetical protein
VKADSDADMLHKNAREALTTSIMAQRFIQRIAPDLAAADPTGLARLMEATVLFMRHIPPMFEQMISIKERSMKLEMPGIKEVQRATMEHDPLEAAGAVPQGAAYAAAMTSSHASLGHPPSDREERQARGADQHPTGVHRKAAAESRRGWRHGTRRNGMNDLSSRDAGRACSLHRGGAWA